MKFIREPFERFFKGETSSSFLLLGVTIIALIIANTGLGNLYNSLLNEKITIDIAGNQLSKSIILWINDGLMAIFFFLIGLEIKREIFTGELSTWKKASLPIFSAIGGMFAPIAIFFLLNQQPEVNDGWAIPMATDIAFTLGILKLLGDRVPYGLKVFLTAFAIVDDLGAILTIAFFYSPFIKWNLILIALGLIALLFLLVKLRLYSKYFTFLVSLVVWFLFLKSGVHATIAGVLIAMTIPIRKKIRKSTFEQSIREAVAVFEDEHQKNGYSSSLLNNRENGAVNTISSLTHQVQSPLQYLESKLHIWVAFVIMPIFAFANAGVAINADNFAPVSLIIAAALVLGNLAGISIMAFVALKLKIAHLPENVTLRQIIATGILGGVGFTMSLFITNLAYIEQSMIDAAKIGILIGSLVAGATGYLLLKITLEKEPAA